MLVVRCTRKLLGRLHAAPLQAAPLDATRSSTLLGDWYANPLAIGRARVVLCVSEKTLLPIVIPARDLPSLGARLATAAGEMLGALGISEALVRAEVQRMAPVAFAPTKSRVVLGSMSDFAYLLGAHLDPARPLLDASLALAKAPCTPLGGDSPHRATAALFRLKAPL